MPNRHHNLHTITFSLAAEKAHNLGVVGIELWHWT